jgi:arsenate reductase
VNDFTARPTRVLFLCTSNSARSQMAEALLRHYGGDRFEVQSAGTNPRAAIHPLTVAALGAIGVSLAGQYPKHLSSVSPEGWDYIITTCDQAREACPVFPDDPEHIHWGFEDPASVEGTDEQRLRAFRRIRDEIKRRVMLFVELPIHRARIGVSAR